MNSQTRPIVPIDPIQTVPSPDIVRTRLSNALRETRLLRQILRIAERVEHERNDRDGKGVGNAR